MKKLIQNREESIQKIRNAVRLITEPVVSTLSPLGSNVLYEDSNGRVNLTNDGVTIAKQISSDDPIENQIIEVIKHGALKTNAVAGDGTTTTTLLTSVLIEEGLKLVDSGAKGILLKKDLEKIGDNIIAHLDPIRIKTTGELENIATISANGDEEIAAHVVDIVKTAGEDGMVLIDQSNKEETIVEKDTGFIIDGGIIAQEYAQNRTNSAQFDDCHIFITDKRIYYQEEAESILEAAIGLGITKLVIVARDYIGKSVNVFSANQLHNEAIDLILVKDNNAKETDNSSLVDLALYCGAELVTEKHGKLVNQVKEEYFTKINKVYSNPVRTVISSPVSDNEEAKKRIQYLKEEKDKDESDEEIKRRLAAMTTGLVTIKVGGKTPIEVQEKIFRYEDAINATRAAMKYGYLAGGGLSILGAYQPEEYPEQYRQMVRRFCEAGVRQIAKNCGQHEEHILNNSKPFLNIGYNAKTGEFEDLVKAGVIDPYKVTEMAIKNSISIAGSILSADWMIVNVKEDNDKRSSERTRG